MKVINSGWVLSVNEKRAHLNTLVKKSLSLLQKRLKRRNYEFEQNRIEGFDSIKLSNLCISILSATK